MPPLMSAKSSIWLFWVSAGPSRHSGACGAFLERATRQLHADRLHGAGIDLEPLGDLAHALSAARSPLEPSGFVLSAWGRSEAGQAVLPSLRVRARPARTRSWIIDRSNSAKTPIIWNSALPPGVVVSMPCW